MESLFYIGLFTLMIVFPLLLWKDRAPKYLGHALAAVAVGCLVVAGFLRGNPVQGGLIVTALLLGVWSLVFGFQRRK